MSKIVLPAVAFLGLLAEANQLPPRFLTATASTLAWACQQSCQDQTMRRKQQSTVEPVFSNLIHYYRLRRMGTRCKADAQKAMLLVTIVNRKKLLKHQPRKYCTMALALPLPPPVTPLFKLHTTSGSR